MTAGWAEVSDWTLNMNYNSNFYSEQTRVQIIKKKTLLSAIYIIGIITSIMNVSTVQSQNKTFR